MNCVDALDKTLIKFGALYVSLFSFIKKNCLDSRPNCTKVSGSLPRTRPSASLSMPITFSLDKSMFEGRSFSKILMLFIFNLYI